MATDTFSVQAGQTTATQIVWAGDGPTLITNTSLTAVVSVGNSNTIKSSDGSGIAPINPNGSLVVDGTRDYYAVTTSATPVVIATYAGGLATFLGITQAMGSLAIPSIHSPNFVHGLAGWTINQDGSAEFNNLTIRGNVILPDGFISNGDGTLTTTPGYFLYNGTPAASNLIYSSASAAGHDKFNNNYLAGETNYINAGALSQALNISGNVIIFYNFTGNPGATFTALDAQVSTANVAIPGFGTHDGITLADFINLNNFATGGALDLITDVNGILNIYAQSGDLNIYKAGHRNPLVNASIPVTSTAFSPILQQSVIAGQNYEFHVKMLYNTTTTAAGNPTISWAHGTTALFNLWMSTARIWDNTGKLVSAAQYTHATGTPGDLAGPGFVANSAWEYDIAGSFIPSASGLIVLSANTSNAADPYAVETGTFFNLKPI